MRGIGYLIQEWLRQNFNPNIGLSNLYNAWIRFRHSKNNSTLINAVQVEEDIQDTKTDNTDSTVSDKNPTSVEVMLVNDLPIGRTCFRSDQGSGIQRGIRGSNQGHESSQRERKGKEHGSRHNERRHCMVCKVQGHINLLHCSKLPEYIPRGSNIKQIPREICKSCLSTIDDSTKCIHKWPRNYNDWMCQKSKTHFILCKDCQKHREPQDWLKENFNPHIGQGNL